MNEKELENQSSKNLPIAFVAASILLGIVAAPLALEIGAQSNGDETILSLHPEVILRQLSVLVSTFLCSKIEMIA